MAKHYLIKSCVQSSTHEHSYALHSAMQDRVIVPRIKTKFGERLFAAAGPTVWKSLLDFVMDASSIDIFKTRLKTYLFELSYHDKSLPSNTSKLYKLSS